MVHSPPPPQLEEPFLISISRPTEGDCYANRWAAHELVDCGVHRLQLRRPLAAELLQPVRDARRRPLVGEVEGCETVPGEDVGIGALLEEELRHFLAVHARGPMKRRTLGDSPVVDAIVDGRGMLAKSSFDVIAKVEGDRVVEIDSAMLAHPLTNGFLLGVIGPGHGRCVERIVAVAHARDPWPRGA